MNLFIFRFLLIIPSPLLTYATAMTSFLCQFFFLFFFQSWTAPPLVYAVLPVTMASLKLVLSLGQKGIN